MMSECSAADTSTTSTTSTTSYATAVDEEQFRSAFRLMVAGDVLDVIWAQLDELGDMFAGDDLAARSLASTLVVDALMQAPAEELEAHRDELVTVLRFVDAGFRAALLHLTQMRRSELIPFWCEVFGDTLDAPRASRADS